MKQELKQKNFFFRCNAHREILDLLNTQRKFNSMNKVSKEIKKDYAFICLKLRELVKLDLIEIIETHKRNKKQIKITKKGKFIRELLVGIEDELK